MTYRYLKMGALALLVVLFIVLSNAVREEPLPVMQRDDTPSTVETLSKALSSISTIEYKQYLKSGASKDSKGSIEIHYYYKRPSYLRVETRSGDMADVDIYTPGGMYEYFPLSRTAYFRERWKDDSPVTFQLNDKLEDIKVRGKYEFYKFDRIAETDCEIMRSVDEEEGSIYEQKVWMAVIEGLKLPVREEYLTDGDINMTCEYEYISINKDIDDSVFQIQPSQNIRIYNAEGIPKLVRDRNEAEKYTKFKVILPEDTPDDVHMNEMYVIPPAKAPSVLISYISDMDTVYLREKASSKNELVVDDTDRVVKVEGRTFAVRELPNESLSVRWIKDGIEFEIYGTYTLRDEVIELVQEISGKLLDTD